MASRKTAPKQAPLPAQVPAAAATPAAQPAALVKSATVARVKKAAPESEIAVGKPKLVRDSFTIPKHRRLESHVRQGVQGGAGVRAQPQDRSPEGQEGRNCRVIGAASVIQPARNVCGLADSLQTPRHPNC